MSSGLSGSCHNAASFAQEYDGKVQVVDNHRISVTQYGSALSAMELVRRGFSAAQIKDWLEERAYDASIYVSVDSMEYLKKGGRITPAAAALATVLNLKPVLTIQGGKLDTFAKARGMRQAEAKMLERLRETVPGASGPCRIRSCRSMWPAPLRRKKGPGNGWNWPESSFRT